MIRRLLESNALLVLALVILAGSIGYLAASYPFIEPPPSPEGEVNVTCYTWVENGTGHANCDPQWIYAPDAAVNVTVKDCNEWAPKYSGEFARERPCGPNFQRKEEH